MKLIKIIVYMLIIYICNTINIYANFQENKVQINEHEKYMQELVNKTIKEKEHELGIKDDRINIYEVRGQVGRTIGIIGNLPYDSNEKVSDIYVIRCNSKDEKLHIRGCL